MPGHSGCDVDPDPDLRGGSVPIGPPGLRSPGWPTQSGACRFMRLAGSRQTQRRADPAGRGIVAVQVWA